jgi:hypothetical protein
MLMELSLKFESNLVYCRVYLCYIGARVVKEFAAFVVKEVRKVSNINT